MAWAQEDYTIEGVKVDVTAESAAVARDQAFAQAQTQAYAQLRTRLHLPPEPLTSAMIQDVAVEEEHFSATRYIATLTVRFDPEAFANITSLPMDAQALEITPHPGLGTPLAPANRIKAKAHFGSIQEWARFEGALERLALGGVAKARVMAITTQEAQIDIILSTSQDIAMAQAAFDRVGLFLIPGRGQEYEVRLK